MASTSLTHIKTAEVGLWSPKGKKSDDMLRIRLYIKSGTGLRIQPVIIISNDLIRSTHSCIWGKSRKAGMGVGWGRGGERRSGRGFKRDPTAIELSPENSTNKNFLSIMPSTRGSSRRNTATSDPRKNAATIPGSKLCHSIQQQTRGNTSHEL